ncbi:transcription factor bHLH143 [Spinacia oleracea]|uniref:Transcription factor bHLH143 n=1 Tax=Spinacia oleracea TaxID=3562 RepID=A0A9R0JYA1_SPIOL|nr:transcription factor bHLH143-like [Spinacia oleracea]
MVELSSSWLWQQHFPSESSVFRNRMIAPVEHRQHEFLPASINPCRVSSNLGLNGFGYSGFPERGHTIEGTGSIQKPVPHQLTQNQCHGEQNPVFPARLDEKPSTCELPCAQQKKYLIFDRSGNETRLIFSSLCPRAENLTTPVPASPAWNLPAEESFGAYHQYVAEKQGKIAEQAWTKTHALCEESGENEIIDEISEMREDTEEINALLYSEDDDDDDDGLDDDDDCDCEEDDDDEVSSGHSPLAKEMRDCEKQEEQECEKDLDNEVGSLERCSKRQKGGVRESPVYYEGVKSNDGDFMNERMMWPTIGSKRPRKDKIHDTLRVLESIIPDLKSKDPLVILDKAISYLKGLKYNAETMSSEDPDSSSSYQPLN